MTESASVWSTPPSFSLWRTAGGWVLLLVGVAGLVLPVLPGTPLIVAGLVMLSADHCWARNSLRRVKLWIRKFRRDPPKPANAHPFMRRPN
jgi:Putative transmembrane protein (PGPGW)